MLCTDAQRRMWYGYRFLPVVSALGFDPKAYLLPYIPVGTRPMARATRSRHSRWDLGSVILVVRLFAVAVSAAWAVAVPADPLPWRNPRRTSSSSG